MNVFGERAQKTAVRIPAEIRHDRRDKAVPVDEIQARWLTEEIVHLSAADHRGTVGDDSYTKRCTEAEDVEAVDGSIRIEV